jgi:hypothetical protein
MSSHEIRPIRSNSPLHTLNLTRRKYHGALIRQIRHRVEGVILKPWTALHACKRITCRTLAIPEVAAPAGKRGCFCAACVGFNVFVWWRVSNGIACGRAVEAGWGALVSVQQP